MIDLKKFANRKVIERIEHDSFFKLKCVNSFFYLIEEFDFKYIDVDDFARGTIVIFKEKAKSNKKVTIEYEMGTLPDISYKDDKGIIKIFSDDDYLNKYPVHNEISKIISSEIISIDDYINELGFIWESKFSEISKEIEICLNSLSLKLKNYLIENS